MGVGSPIVGALVFAVLAGAGPAGIPPNASRFVESGPAHRAEVWAVGDGANGGPAGGGVARMIAAADPDRFLYLGDVYQSGTAEEFASNYAPTFGQLDEVAAPTIGNHESSNADQGYRPYWTAVTGRPTPPYYAFRVAGWQIFSLNSQIDHGTGSEQLDWLRSKTRRPSRCRIAFWHRPRFSAGTEHGDAPDIAPLTDALRGEARLILNGHEHNMQRVALPGGLTELVAGAGGSELTEIDPGYGRLRFGSDRRYGAVRLRIRPGRAAYAFVIPGGKVIDHGVVRC
jgi:hypothetical protein